MMNPAKRSDSAQPGRESLLLACMLLVTCESALAGYRSAGRPDSANPEAAEADAFLRTAKSFRATADASEVLIEGQTGSARPARHAGVTDQITLKPAEKVVVTLSHVRLKTGTTVFAYTLHGGRINGKLTDSLTVDQEGKLVFDFEAGQWFGNYPLVLRCGGREEEISFWVNERSGSP